MGGYTTIAALRGAKEQFSRLQGEVFASRGEVTINVQWTANREVLLTCSDCDVTRVENRTEHWRDVRIAYRLRADAQ